MAEFTSLLFIRQIVTIFKFIFIVYLGQILALTIFVAIFIILLATS